MGGLFGGGKTPQAQKQQPAGALQVQTSVYGAAKPIIYGKNRVPINLLHYFNFTPIPHTTKQKTGGKGGSKSTSNTTYTYKVALALAFAVECTGVGTIWKNKEKHTLASLGFTLHTGSAGQVAWVGLPAGQNVPYANTAFLSHSAFDLGDSPSLPNINIEAKGLVPFNAGTIDDALPSDIVNDYLTNLRHGAGLANKLANLDTGAASFRKYVLARGLFISPIENNQRQAGAFLKDIADICNSAIVWREGKINLIPYGDATITGNGATYTPNLTPLYDLTEDDFLHERGQPPVRHKEKPPEQQYNHHRIEYNARSNDYNPLIVELKDQADIDDNGLRTKAVTTYKAITLDSVARDVLQIMQQRDLHVKNTYSFRLGIRHSLLEPMDLVTITTSQGLGLDRQLVRIIEVVEQDDAVDIVAEEMNVGVANAPLFNTQVPGGYNQDFNVTAGNVSDPLIMNAPGMLTETGYEQWIAVAGTDPNWGGCVVWVSDDDIEYRRVGEVMGAARYGSISTATFPAGSADYDTASVLRVQLYAAGQILSGTQLDVDEYRTLLYVGGEWMSYRDAALVSGTTYDLDTFRRGAYGSTRASHAIGQGVAVCDEAIFRMPYDKGNIGRTVYFKFQSFNVFGGGFQDLDACVAYTHVLGASEKTAPMEYVAIAGSGQNLLQNQHSWFLDAVLPTLTKSPGAMAVDSPADAAAFGGYWLRVVTNNTSTGDNFIYFGASSTDRNIPITPGDYILSFYGKADVAGHLVRGRLYFDIGTQVDTPDIALTTSRARYAYKLTVPSTASLTELLMFFNRSGVAGRTVHIDGLMLEPMIGTLVNPGSWVPGNSARDAVSALLAAIAAQDTADGKIDTYIQPTMPPGTLGDLWFDSDDGNKMYRHNGTTYVVAQDTAIGQAILAAAGAQATADGKITTFYAASAPTATAVGDLWVNTVAKTVNRWNGSAWIEVADVTADKLSGTGTNLLWEEYSLLQMAQSVLSDPNKSIPICNSAGLTTLETIANGSAQGGYEYHAVTGTTAPGSDYFRLSESATDNNIQIEVGKKYLVSYYARSTTAGHQIRPWVRGGSSIDGTIATLTTSRARYTAVFDITSGGGSCHFGFFCNTSAVAGRHVYIDGVMIEEMIGNATTAKTFAPGPSARNMWRTLVNTNNLNGGRNTVLNPQLTSNMSGANSNQGGITAVDQLMCDNWACGLYSSSIQIYRETQNAPVHTTGGYQFTMYIGNNLPAIANGATARAIIVVKKRWTVQPGEKWVASVWSKSDFNAALPAGVTGTAYLRCAFYDATGTFISYGFTTVSRTGGWAKYATDPMTVPANAVEMDVRIDFNITNSSGASLSMGAAGIYPWIWRTTDFECYKVTNLDSDVGDGTTYGRYGVADGFDVSGVRRIGLRIGNSGHRLGNQRNIPRSNTSAYGMQRTTTALSATSAGAVSVNAHTCRYGGYSVAYNAVSNAVTGLTVGTTYVIYCSDPDLTGGTKTYFAGTDPVTVMNISDDIYVVGQITIPSSGSSSGGGSGTGDPNDWCVDYDTVLPDGRLVRDLRLGDTVECIDVTTGERGMFPLMAMGFGEEECYRLVTPEFATVIQSKSAPMDLPDGRTVRTTEMFGKPVYIRAHGKVSLSFVCDLEYLGKRRVLKPDFGNRMFFAGENEYATIATHNAIYKP